MKFVYQYRTSDNAIHEGEIAAADRDSAFAALKKQGIRPSRLDIAPGVFNILFGAGKRWMAILLLAFGLVAVVVLWLRDSVAAAPNLERRQLVGDPAILEPGVKNGWSDLISGTGNLYLVQFIQPGRVVNSTIASRDAVVAIEQDLRDVEISSDELMEYRQVKEMLNGIKRELREYVADGGTVELYVDRLRDRQNLEVAYYGRAVDEVEKGRRTLPPDELMEVWKKTNENLRSLGIKMVPMPEELQ